MVYRSIVQVHTLLVTGSHLKQRLQLCLEQVADCAVERGPQQLQAVVQEASALVL